MTTATPTSARVGTRDKWTVFRGAPSTPYNIAILSTLATLWITLHLPALLGISPLLMLFLIPIMLTAYIGGFGPGIAATLLAGLLAYFFILSPAIKLQLPEKTDDMHWLLLMVTGSLITLMSEAMHRSSRRVEESRERYAVTLRSIGDAVISADTQGRVTLLNGEAERLTGWTNQEARGQPLTSVFPIINEKTRTAIEDPVEMVMRRGEQQAWADQTVLVTRDQREFFVEHSAAPIKKKDGVTIGVVLVFRDCTERKKAGNALALFRTLVDRISDGIEVVDPASGRFLDANENTCVNLGYTRKEMLGLTVFDIAPNVTPADFEETKKRLRETGNFFVEGLHRRKDGTDFPVELNKQMVRLDREYLVVVARDITDRKQAENMLEFVARRGWTGRHEDFLAQLVAYLGKSLGVDYVFVGRLKDLHTVETVGYYAQGLIAPDMEYTRRGTPSDNVVGKMICHYEEGLQELFPGDRLLAEMGAQSYLGIPLADSSGRPVGLLAVLDRKPMPDSRPVAALLQIAAIRAAGELERLAAETTLRESEDMYRSLVSASPDAVSVTTADGFIEFMSPRANEIFGVREPQEIMGRNLFEWVAPEDRARARAHLQTLLKGETIHRGEYALLRRDGSPFTGETNAAVLRASDGRPKRVIFITRDVTERKQAEEMQKRLATAVEQAAEDIIVTDASGKIIYANPAFEHLTGFSRQEVIGKNPRFLKSGRHDDAYYQRMWETLRRGEVWAGRMTNRKKDGTIFEQESTISPIRDSTGRIINYVGVRRDVTREAALESQLRQSQKLEAIGRLAGGIAHDFNNLLTVIRGNASLLMLCNQAKTPEITDGAQQIVEASERAANLTRQLLMFSRQQTIQSQQVDLNIVVTQMTKLLERILGEDIALVTACQPGLPAIQADAGMMEQILLNLAVNSRDAMPHGGTLTIATSTETTEFQKDGGGGPRRKVSCVKLTVNDTGTGIDPGNLPHIFEPFFSTKEVGKGTGLGLATVHGIVLQHNGQITVSSDPGNGATFQIYFPALSGGKTKKGTAPLNKDFPLGWETLLVVEDENIVRIAVCGMLQRFGYKVLQAVSGRDALTVWTREKENIHLLLTDIVMPDGMTGFELASRLQGEKPALKIIYTSGYSGDLADKRVTLVEGVNFLQKPYAPRKLAQALRDNLDPEPVPPADVAGEADRSLPR